VSCTLRLPMSTCGASYAADCWPSVGSLGVGGERMPYDKFDVRGALTAAVLVCGIIAVAFVVFGFLGSEEGFSPSSGAAQVPQGLSSPSLRDLQGRFAYIGGSSRVTVEIYDADAHTALAQVYPTHRGTASCVAFLIERTLFLVFPDGSELTFEVISKDQLAGDGLLLLRT